MARIDLNSDVGESFGSFRFGDDRVILDQVTSANVACGFHAGDPLVMRATCRAAAEREIAIGAHVGYRDLAGFGRRFIDCAPDELAADVLYQLAALDGIARAQGARVRYVKPHGALYNAIVHHEAQARAVVDAIAAYDGSLALLALPGSVALDIADEVGIRGVREVFADRAYEPDGTLVSRRESGAVLHDPREVAARTVRFASEGVVTARDGSDIRVAADSICLHGDTPGAAAMAVEVRAALEAEGVEIASFA